MTFAFFSKCPEIDGFHFRRFFVPKTRRVFLLEMPHFPQFEIFEMPHFENQMGKIGHFKVFERWKVGHFEEKSRDQFQNEKGTEHECVRFFWHFTEKCKYCHMTKSSFTCFWGISWYLPYELQMHLCALALTKTQSRIE